MPSSRVVLDEILRAKYLDEESSNKIEPLSFRIEPIPPFEQKLMGLEERLRQPVVSKATVLAVHSMIEQLAREVEYYPHLRPRLIAVNEATLRQLFTERPRPQPRDPGRREPVRRTPRGRLGERLIAWWCSHQSDFAKGIH